jgi:2-amino-4-hydroxy-6-hydroxymethyldihydropteridine diphosphokinase
VSVTCLIALGSNIGDRRSHLDAALAGLAAVAGLEITAVSPLYETAPVGGPGGQGAFLNAVVAGRTTLPPADLLAALHGIETARERRRVVHWGPRTLDLDLLIHGDTLSDDPALALPHPRMHERRFVMVPAADVAPGLVHPVLGRRLADIAAALPVEEGDLRVAASDWAALPEGAR